MAEQPIQFTEADIKDSNLLLRLLRKFLDRILSVGSRVSNLEAAPPPMSVQQISRELQASGSAPLNIAQLPGVARQPQLAGAPRLQSPPTGQVLQQYQDTQLLLVGTTSTGFALDAVVGGNPNTLYQLISSLSTSSVGSTSTNLMTLDTVQTSTGDKTLTGFWYFNADVGIGTTSTSHLNAPSRTLVVEGNFPAIILQTTQATPQEFFYALGPGGIGLFQDIGGASTQANNFMVWRTSTADSSYSVSEKMRLTSDGSLKLWGKLVSGNGTPRYNLECYSVSGGSGMQIHAMTSDADSGFYSGALDSGGGAISGGTRYDGANWIAKDSNATTVRVQSAGIEGYTNSALTIGNSYTPTRRFRADNGGFIVDQTIYNYNGITTAGEGVTIIPATVNVVNSSSSQNTTNILASAPAGLYRVCAYMDTSSAGTAGTATLVIGWNDGDSAETASSSALTLSAVTGNYVTMNQPLYSGASQNITYRVDFAGVLGSAKYDLRLALERMY